MSSTLASTGTEGKTWGGGSAPLKASYGKMMMWFFIVSDALTFSGFLAAYGFSRFKYIGSWPIADEVFTHVPFVTWSRVANDLCGFHDFCADHVVRNYGTGRRCRTSYEKGIK